MLQVEVPVSLSLSSDFVFSARLALTLLFCSLRYPIKPHFPSIFVLVVPPSGTRHRPDRPSLRSSGASQPSLEQSSASLLSESSISSAWSHKTKRLIPCCIDRQKQRGPVASFFVKLLCCPYEPPAKLLQFMHNALESWAYGIPFLIFTFLLLFGQPIQYLWFPKSADLVFNYLFTFTLAFFVIDIAMRCYVSPAYFVFEFFGLDYRYDAEGRRRPRPRAGGLKGGWGDSTIKIGSFMFWCDVVSTLTLLYDISWINNSLLERTESTIFVDVLGVAVSVTATATTCSYVFLFQFFKTATWICVLFLTLHSFALYFTLALCYVTIDGERISKRFRTHREGHWFAGSCGSYRPYSALHPSHNDCQDI